ncbi:MAG: hypothetical protein ACJ764_01045 [Solirubrobacteraceae bacterium]
MSHLPRRMTLPILVCLMSGVLASTAAASSPGKVFHPRVGNALGLIPPFGHHNYQSDPSLAYIPVTYHGGQTMTGGVTVHTIFWAPPGYTFSGAPAGSKSYIALVQQYLTDVAAASTGTAGGGCTAAACNAFTVEPQYSWGTTLGGVTSGNNTIHYNAASDSILDTHPYPTHRCISPGSIPACITDAEVQAEVDRLIQSTGGSRGLHDLWYVLTPPNVDECAGEGICGTSAFAGYHSLSNLHKHGVTIYGIGIDPIIEIGGFPSGQDPNGNPDAELAIDVVAHEVNEAMTDPTGVGWMDPNGFEMADKCDLAPERGTPLGYAGPDHAPFNQVVHGHKYLIQEMWSNNDHGCVQSSVKTSSPLPLPQVNLTQFSSLVRGNTENATAGIHVTVKLVRAGAGGGPVTVATGSGTTKANGSWSVTLSGRHAVGDDRDQIDVNYSGPKAPRNQVILTGNGGDPFILSGWTGWTALDQGSALTNHDKTLGGAPSLTLLPCFQAGLLTYAGAPGPEPATNFCGTVSDAARVPLGSPVTKGDHVTASSIDNRAFFGTDRPGGGNPNGALVKLTVPVGEPDAVADFSGNLPGFKPTGFPRCATSLASQAAECLGLVPRERYTLSDGSQHLHGKADASGALFKRLSVRGGDSIKLSNGATTLTTLHVARLRVHILGEGPGFVDGGTCSPGDYFGGPLTSPPISQLAGEPSSLVGGAALTGQTCSASGDATGMPAEDLAQTDERSGGVTFTDVAELFSVSPLDGETLYGRFTAMAVASSGSAQVGLVILRVGHQKPVFQANNANTARGVTVSGLAPGRYIAAWVVRSRNGDTRTIETRFIEEPSSRSQNHSRPRPKIACRFAGHHQGKIACHVAFARSAGVSGPVRIRISRGGQVAALGHGRMSRGSATLTMRELRRLHKGSWKITVVVYQSRHRGRTSTRQQVTVTMPLVVM